MKLTKIVRDPNTGCNLGSSCPGIFEDEFGDWLVQGVVLSAEEAAALTIPRGEAIVRLPRRCVELAREVLAQK